MICIFQKNSKDIEEDPGMLELIFDYFEAQEICKKDLLR